MFGLKYHAPCTGTSGGPHAYWPGVEGYADARTGPNRLYRFGSDGGEFVHWVRANTLRERVIDLMAAYGPCGQLAAMSDWHYNQSALWRATYAGLWWPPSP